MRAIWNAKLGVLVSTAGALALVAACGQVQPGQPDATGDDATAPDAQQPDGPDDGNAPDGPADAAPPDGPAPVVCTQDFTPWFRAGFEGADGGILGVADFPSSPWRTVAGRMTIQDRRARANAAATVVATQGKRLGGNVTRVRFTFQPIVSNNEVHVLVNANSTGQNGLDIGVNAVTGELSASENGTAIGSTSVGALPAGSVNFVEVLIDGNRMDATIATGNYGSVAGSTVRGQLTSSSVPQSAGGSFAGMRFVGGGSVDDLSVALCGQRPPAYQRVFFDDFERASSQSVGSAIVPATPWTNDSTNVTIAGGMLTFKDGGSVLANAGQHYPNQGLRVRATVKFGPDAWLLIGVNGTAAGDMAMTGFDMWRQSNTVVVGEFSGGGGATFNVGLSTSTLYYVQFDVDERNAVVTVRSGSFDGPAVFAYDTTGIIDAPSTDRYVKVSNPWSPSSVAVEDLTVERYTP